MQRASWAVSLILTGSLGAGQAQPARPAEQFALTQGRTLMQAFYAVKLEGLWNTFTPDVRAQWGDLAGFRAFRELGVQQYGAEIKLVRERTFSRDGEVFYVRSATFEKAPKLVWALVMGFKNLRVTTFGITLEEDHTQDQQARSRYGPL